MPLTDGRMCIYSLMDTDVVIDINGYYRRGNGAGFTPIDAGPALRHSRHGRRACSPVRFAR